MDSTLDTKCNVRALRLTEGYLSTPSDMELDARIPTITKRNTSTAMITSSLGHTNNAGKTGLKEATG